MLDLIERADNGLPTPVGLMTNGMIAIGMLAPRKALAERPDVTFAAIVELADTPEGTTEAQWSADRALFSSTSTKLRGEVEAEEQKLRDELEQIAGPDGVDFDAAPAELTRRAIEHQGRSALSLRDVQILAPGQRGITRLDVLRVILAQIDAWWPIVPDEDGSISLTLFESD